MMSIRSFLAALLVSWPALALADAAVPATPAGRALEAWLEAFNSGDRARLASFIQTYEPGSDLDSAVAWRAEAGGYDLLDVFGGDSTNVFFHVKARISGREDLGRLTVSAEDPAHLTTLRTWRLPPGAKYDAVSLETAARAKLVARIAEEFNRYYVFPDIGKQMAAAVRRNESRGEYRSLLYGEDLARKLTEDLREESRDIHVLVDFSYFVPPAEAVARPEAEARRLAAVNCGFVKLEHLPSNVGYLKFDTFANPQYCAPTASAAMTFVADSAALILDLRDNHGGNPDMALFILSYLFDERTHLADTFTRADNTTRETWTLPYVPGKKFLGKPIFILTSKETFSAAEALSYFLKYLDRAIVIGETTGGGAHRTETKPIDEHFSVRVPTARSISPVTKSSWEGTGVEPDVKVSADEALDVATKLAAEAGGH